MNRLLAFPILVFLGVGAAFFISDGHLEYTGLNASYLLLFAACIVWFVAATVAFWNRLGEVERFTAAVRSCHSKEVDEATAAGTLLNQVPGDGHLAERIFRTDGFRDDAADLWSDDLLVEMPGWARVGIDVLPAVFTAVGILFTFLGLVTGLTNIDPSGESAAMMSGMRDLLQGVSVAFHSSILGIYLSVAALTVARQFGNDVELHASALSTALAVLNRRSKDELLRATAEATHRSEQKLRQLTELAKSQDSKLGTIASDLPTKIAEALQPSFQNIATSLADVGRHASDAHQEMLGVVMDRFLEQFDEKLGTQLDSLGEVLDRTLEWHEKTSTTLEQMLGRLNENLSLQKQLSEQLTDSVLRQEAIVRDQDAQAAQYEQAAEKISTSVAQLLRAQQLFVTTAEELPRSIKEFGGLTKQLENSMREGLHQNAQILAGTSERVESLHQTLKLSIDSTDEALQQTLKHFDSATAEAVDRFNGTLIGLAARLDEIQQVVDAFTHASAPRPTRPLRVTPPSPGAGE